MAKANPHQLYPCDQPQSFRRPCACLSFVSCKMLFIGSSNSGISAWFHTLSISFEGAQNILHHQGIPKQVANFGSHSIKIGASSPGISLQTAPQPLAPLSEIPYLLSSGPFHHDFNHRDALWCMDILHYVKPEIKLFLTGTGADLNSLHSFRAALMTKEFIRFTGTVDFLEPWLANASIILHQPYSRWLLFYIGSHAFRKTSDRIQHFRHGRIC